jgi:hypothetical protein
MRRDHHPLLLSLSWRMHAFGVLLASATSLVDGTATSPLFRQCNSPCEVSYVLSFLWPFGNSQYPLNTKLYTTLQYKAGSTSVHYQHPGSMKSSARHLSAMYHHTIQSNQIHLNFNGIEVRTVLCFNKASSIKKLHYAA